MRIAVFAVEQSVGGELAALLREEGFEVVARKLSSSLAPVEEVDKVVLIYPGQGTVAIGEQTTLIRSLVGARPHLLLCIPLPSPPDRDLLHQCGASEIISLNPWSTRLVGERVLAELILSKASEHSSYGRLQGATKPMRELYKQMATLAPLDEPVLVSGETGTGKELVAQELHNRGGRKGPFLPFLCPATSPELLPSELFGHKEGAFTDARHNRKGMLVEAGKGTVFLDEIGDLDLKAQAQLLRVLEDRRVRPIGANTWEEIRARIVMATHRNLEQECAEGKFRYDLYMRLQGFTLHLPPLRERRADLSLLAHHFIKGWNTKQRAAMRVPEGAFDCLFSHDWPGNVRELRNVIEEASAFGDQATQYISDLRLKDRITLQKQAVACHSFTFNPATDALRDVVKRAERQYLRAVLSMEKGNKDAAAMRAGLSRSQFYEKIKALNDD